MCAHFFTFFFFLSVTSTHTSLHVSEYFTYEKKKNMGGKNKLRTESINSTCMMLSFWQKWLNSCCLRQLKCSALSEAGWEMEIPVAKLRNHPNAQEKHSQLFCCLSAVSSNTFFFFHIWKAHMPFNFLLHCIISHMPLLTLLALFYSVFDSSHMFHTALAHIVWFRDSDMNVNCC